MPRELRTTTRKAALAITASSSTTAEVVFDGYSGGVVHVPAGSGLTSLTFYAAPVAAGTFLALKDASGTAVTLTVAASTSYQLPTALFGCASFKMVGNTTGTVDVSLKS